VTIVNDDDLVEVYRAASNVQAQMMVSELEDSGIKAMIDGEALQNGLGAQALGWTAAPRLLVHPSDAGRARAILERIEHRKAAAR
jgi:Putative prokaryotic signal transducing protein